MLPSSEIRWLRRAATGAGFLLALLALLIWPARHAVQEIWPGRVQEWVLADGSTRLVSSSEPVQGEQVLAHSHPHSLMVLEFHNGGREYGFLVRHDEENSVWWFEARDGLQAVDPATLRRSYPPNALLFVQRLDLMRQRLLDRRSAGRPLPAAVPVAQDPPQDLAEGDDV